MSLHTLLFPAESRTFPGKRWSNVLLRSGHLCAAAVYSGGLYFMVEPDQLAPWYLLTAVSGGLMLAADLYSNGKHLFQNRGFFILVKLLILGLLFHTDTTSSWAILAIIFLSGITSHATGRFRYYSIFHGRQL